MASGTGERPLGSIESEKDLLGLSGIKAMQFSVTAGNSKTLTFPSESKSGLLILANGNTDKHGVYLFGETTNGSISLTAIVTPSQSTTGATASSHTITVSNGSSGGTLYVSVLAFLGALPTVT